MTFNPSLIDGPVPIAIFGEPYTTDEGNEARDVIGYVEGYHLNISPQVYTDDLAPYLMTPTQPRRVFAGAATVFLKFADEEEARSMLGAYWIDPEPEEV
jgi:hypothetical protein